MDFKELDDKKRKLANHKLYGQIKTLGELRLFMENHVYAVLDFMSLTKHIQHHFAPTEPPWVPPKHPELVRFINEVVLGEESDRLPDGRHLSHFEMYLLAMKEIGANTQAVQSFVDCLRNGHLARALNEYCPHPPARDFTKQTYQQVFEWDIHKIVAAFCHGREKVIPLMFLNLAEKCGIKKSSSPMFFYYLERHIELDGDEHGPMADKLLQAVVGESESRYKEAMEAADKCLDQRLQFWDGLSDQIYEQRSTSSQSL